MRTFAAGGLAIVNALISLMLADCDADAASIVSTTAGLLTAPVQITSQDTITSPGLPEDVRPAACCKTCTTGKACGNSCIAKNKDCHQPPGCACDG